MNGIWVKQMMFFQPCAASRAILSLSFQLKTWLLFSSSYQKNENLDELLHWIGTETKAV